MSTPTWIKDILRGGLPEVLDLGNQSTAGNENQSGNGVRPEQNPPTTLTGRDNANPPGNFLMSVTQNQILVATGFVIAALALVHVVKK